MHKRNAKKEKIQNTVGINIVGDFMDFLLFREIVAVAGTAIASWTDLKTRLIHDKLTYPMIAIGLFLNLLEIYFKGISIDSIMLIAIPLIVFIIGFALYFAGKVGGGDIKLLAAISLLLPLLNGEIFILNVLFSAAMFSIVFISAYFGIKYFRKGINFKENYHSVLKAVFYGIAVIAYFSILMQLGLIRFEKILILSIPILFALVFLALEPGIRKNFFFKKVKLNELEEDEVIAIESLDSEIVKKLGLGFKGVLGEKEIEKLKELGLREVGVYRDLPPFAPFLLIGVIVAILKPDLIAWIFT